jgi:ABC-type Fe3+-hydroxamate transport system substrate-binding protein
MKYQHLVLIVLTAALASACASRQAKTESNESTSSAPPPKTTPAKETAKKETVKKEAPEGEIVGKPAAGSKFSKLKLGMTLNQVEKAIGRPTKQWTHPTGKASIPFYFGADRWVIQYSYKGEGVLTINSGGDQLLTRIEVNKAE